MNEKYSILKPDIFDRFFCKGGECNYSCCGGWRIDFSHEEYKNLIGKRKLGKNIECYFHDKEGDERYKSISLNSQGNCPLLDSEGLCSVQKKYGAEYLSNTCRIYPRLISQYNNIFELSLSTGCEKVLELLLENENGIVVKDESIPINKVSNYKKILCNVINKDDIEKRPILNYWFDIKVLGLGILMERSYSIEERLLLLGIAMSRIDELENSQRIIEIPNYVNSFLDNISDGSLKEQLNSFYKNEDLKVATAAFNTAILFYNKDNENGIINEIFENLSIPKIEPQIIQCEDKSTYYDFKTDISYNKQAYNDCIEKYNSFMLNKEYFLENYMVLSYITLQIPFKPITHSLFENYKGFIIMFVILIFCMIGYINESKSIEDMIKLISIISRNLSHNDASIDNINGILKSVHIDTIAHMAILLL